MPLVVALLCFLIACIGLGLFARGLLAMRAVHQLDGRIAHLTTGVSPPRQRPRIPTMFAARGRDRQEIVEKLKQAGFQGSAAIENFLWLRIAATVGAIVIAALLSRILWGGFLAQPLLLLLAPALTYLGSKSALRFAAKARQRGITAELPFLLDLMLMMLESGVSFDNCLRSIAREEAATAPYLNGSLRLLIEDIDRGMSYENALDRWAARIAVPGSKDLATLFRQGLLQGIELGPALRQFIREFTERRIGAAREAMGKIAVKLVVVMILFFMPALFIVVAGPPVTSLFETIRALSK